MPPRRSPGAKFANVRLLVDDFSRSWRFYRDVLGLTPEKGHGAPPYGEFRPKGGARVAIFERERMAGALGIRAGPRDARTTGPSAVVFETPDVDAFARHLRRRKVPLLAGPTDRPVWGIRTVHFRDPDGHLIEVYAPRLRGGD